MLRLKIVSLVTLIVLMGCQSKDLGRLRLLSPLAPIAFTVDSVVNLSLGDDYQVQNDEVLDCFISAQDQAFLRQYLDDFMVSIAKRYDVESHQIDKVRRDPVFRQLPEMPVTESTVIILPYKSIQLRQDVYRKMLMNSLKVKGLYTAHLQFSILHDREAIGSSLFKYQDLQFLELELAFTIFDQKGHEKETRLVAVSRAPLENNWNTNHCLNIDSDIKPHVLDVLAQLNPKESVSLNKTK